MWLKIEKGTCVLIILFTVGTARVANIPRYYPDDILEIPVRASSDSQIVEIEEIIIDWNAISVDPSPPPSS